MVLTTEPSAVYRGASSYLGGLTTQVTNVNLIETVLESSIRVSPQGRTRNALHVRCLTVLGVLDICATERGTESIRDISSSLSVLHWNGITVIQRPSNATSLDDHIIRDRNGLSILHVGGIIGTDGDFCARTTLALIRHRDFGTLRYRLPNGTVDSYIVGLAETFSKPVI